MLQKKWEENLNKSFILAGMGDSVDLSSSFSFFSHIFICLLAQQQYYLLIHTENYIMASQSQIQQCETIGLQMLDSFFTSSCALGGMKEVCLFLLFYRMFKKNS